jgi:hypothetical protein
VAPNFSTDRKESTLLTHPTHEALGALKLDGMAEAFAELITQDRGRGLDPVAWIGLMLDREQARRDTRRFQSRLVGGQFIESVRRHPDLRGVALA